MAMIPMHWSLNGISIELGMDRRTVGRHAGNVKPSSKGPNGVLFRMRDIVAAVIEARYPDDNNPQPEVVDQAVAAVLRSKHWRARFAVYLGRVVDCDDRAERGRLLQGCVAELAFLVASHFERGSPKIECDALGPDALAAVLEAIASRQPTFEEISGMVRKPAPANGSAAEAPRSAGPI
jgi:AcrR family transcriptional regulator